MVWKKKEKELTKKEAIGLAKAELLPYWISSTPLFAGVEENGEFSTHPLDEEYNNNTWIIFFLDYTSPHFNVFHNLVKEWDKRYSRHGLKPIIVFKGKYPPTLEKKTITRTIDPAKNKIPLVIDHDNLLHKSFGISLNPTIILINSDQENLRIEGIVSTTEFEENIQTFLRKSDPGLPLRPALPDTGYELFETSTRELGKNYPSKKLKFVKEVPANLNAEFIEQIKESLDHIILFGEWDLNDYFVSTSDPNATLIFKSNRTDVFLIGESESLTIEPIKILINSDDNPIIDMFCGKDISYDEEANTVCEINQFNTYGLLSSLTKDKSIIKINFSALKNDRLILYSLVESGAKFE